MKRKITALCVVIAMLTVAIVGGTFAYFTDTDEAVNVMTMGNVKIEQHEYQRALDENGNYKTATIDGVTSYVLEAFEQGKELLPIVGDPSLPGGAGYAGYDTIPVRMSQVDSYGGMDVFDGKNAIDKFVTVENTGKSDAYVRTLVAFEIGNCNEDLISSSYHLTWIKNAIGTINVRNNNYALIELVYNGGQLNDGSWRHEKGVLPAGDTSYPNLSQVYLKSAATNEDAAALDGNGDGIIEVLVLTQAVQAAGFDSADVALDAGFGDVTVVKAAEWFGLDVFKAPVLAENDTELNNAITSGETSVLLGSGSYIIPDSAQGKTLTIIGNGDTVIATQDDGSYEGCDYSLDGSTVTFEGVTINTDSTTYTGYARCSGTYNNCTINGTYTLYGKSVFNNCTFNVTGDVYNIWTWGGQDVEFNNCTFNCDGKALLVYNQNCNVKITNCVFNDNGDDTITGKSAIETGKDNDNTYYNITITDSEFNGFAENSACVGYQNIVGNKNSMSKDKLNVVVDGVDVY